jgi:hypothetical protein
MTKVFRPPKTSSADVAKLQSLQSRPEIQQHLRDFIVMPAIAASPEQQAILIDYLTDVALFTRQIRLDSMQIATLFDIAMHVHTTAMSKNMTMNQAFSCLRDVLVAHSVFRPPFSFDVFTMDHVVQIQEFFLQHYFRFYKLYFFAFGQKEEVDFALVEKRWTETVDVSSLLPLKDFVLEADHLAKLAAEEEARRKDQEEKERAAAEALAAEQEKARLEREAAEAEARNKTVTVAEMQTHISALRGELTQMSAAQMDALEEQLRRLEQQLQIS